MFSVLSYFVGRRQIIVGFVDKRCLSMHELSKTLKQGVLTSALIFCSVLSYYNAEAKAVSLVDSLLRGANEALAAKRLTTPEHDNAYDRFQSVLLLDPDNSQARSGLQAILISYAQFIRDDLRHFRLSNAKRYLTRMEAYYPNNALIDDLKQEYAKAEKKYRLTRPKQARPTVRPEEQDYREIAISEQQLRSKSPELVSKLSDLAIELAKSDESILIYVRNDADGRWVYKQLKKAAQGYRVRGDIRIGKPKLRILPPID